MLRREVLVGLKAMHALITAYAPGRSGLGVVELDARALSGQGRCSFTISSEDLGTLIALAEHREE